MALISRALSSQESILSVLLTACHHIRLRIAILSFTLSFPLLTGNPIAGALLSPPRLLWFRPIILAGVRQYTSTLESALNVILTGFRSCWLGVLHALLAAPQEAKGLQSLLNEWKLR